VESFSAYKRAIASVSPPGGYDTIIVIGRSGKACAWLMGLATANVAAKDANIKNRRLRFIRFSY
jgi:hypothetical protein